MVYVSAFHCFRRAPLIKEVKVEPDYAVTSGSEGDLNQDAGRINTLKLDTLPQMEQQGTWWGNK